MNETPQVQELIPLSEVAMRQGYTPDLVRGRMKNDPVLKSLFRRIGRNWVAESANLPRITERLSKK